MSWNLKLGRNRDFSTTAVLIGISTTFLVLALIRLDLPSYLVFDEIFYVGAAKQLVIGASLENREHPILGKVFIGIGMIFFGPNSFGWRIAAVVAGALGTFFVGRAVLNLTRSPAAGLIASLLIASNFLVFVTSRLALLDPFMFLFAAAGLSAYATSMRDVEREPRGRMICALFLGLAFGCKWSVAPLVVTIAAHMAFCDRQKPVSKIAGALASFALVFLTSYFVTFAPGFFVRDNPLQLPDILPLQLGMNQMLGLYIRPHAAASQWWEWVVNVAPMWLVYRDHVLLMAGNPVSMTLIVPIVLAGLVTRDVRNKVGFSFFLLGYVICLLFWVVNGKPVQFYYHYLLASTLGLCAVAVALGEWWDRGRKWPALAVVLASLGCFAAFFPVLSAANVDPERYAFLPGWAVDRSKGLPVRPNAEAELAKMRNCLNHPARYICPL